MVVCVCDVHVCSRTIAAAAAAAGMVMFFQVSQAPCRIITSQPKHFATFSSDYIITLPFTSALMQNLTWIHFLVLQSFYKLYVWKVPPS